MENIYSVAQDPQHGLVLRIDEQQLFCNSQPAMLVPSNISREVNLLRIPCGKHCPKCKIILEGDDPKAQITCGAIALQFKLNIAPPTKLKIY